MKTTNYLLILSCVFLTTLQSRADVPEVDAVTSKIQSEFAAGSLPTLKDLTRRYQWTCGQFSTIPEQTEVTLDASVDTYNSFNGVITSANRWKDYGGIETRAWAEAKDHKSLEYMDTQEVTTKYESDNLNFVKIRRYFDQRVYKGNLIIEMSYEVSAETPAFYNLPMALWGHAISNPERAVVSYFVCPLN